MTETKPRRFGFHIIVCITSPRLTVKPGRGLNQKDNPLPGTLCTFLSTNGGRPGQNKRQYKMTRVEMKKETTRELLERLQEYDALNVMKAYVEGKEIECSPLDKNQWTPINDPGWSWHLVRYRIKPGPKYRPYKGLFEFAGVLSMPGKAIIRKKDSDVWYTIHSIEDKMVVLQTDAGTYNISYERLLSTCTWDDGSPCGVMVKDEDK